MAHKASQEATGQQGAANVQEVVSQQAQRAVSQQAQEGKPQAPEACAQLPEKPWIRVLATVATVLAVMMYVSYIPQITNNLAGNYGSPVQPFVAFVACTIWAVYGYCKRDRDWALLAALCQGRLGRSVSEVTCCLGAVPEYCRAGMLLLSGCPCAY